MNKRFTIKPTAHNTKSDLVFQKSSYCQTSECMLVAVTDNGDHLIRDSKDPLKQTLRFSPAEWSAFLKGVQHNEFGTP
ncbi:MAG TPA: DUF397 domain-containing protein [Candidatus Saccharimonadales bacterium]|nr:DUF397 domain-containing protein [Candidatus Saccharimonadales bacterium]